MLTIYSASAGTGKTHTLTGEYLKLLFKGTEEHRHILAVTFTNKATAEMKRRIIEELFSLADGQKSDYISELSNNGTKDENKIRAKAKQILITILNDYSAFHISTIDHFFQHTIRAFTREIGLQGNFAIELDETQMMDESVDNMLSELGNEDKKQLTTWLLRFIEDKIEEGKSWDIRDDIKKLGEQIFKETYKKYSDEIQKDLEQKQFLTNYLEELHKIIQLTKKTAKELGEKGVALIKQYGMQPSDFKKSGGRSVFLYFERLISGEIKEPSATFCGLIDNVDGYFAKTATKEQKQAAERLYSGGMNDLIRGVLSFFENLTNYYTAVEITKNFYALGIITDLSQHIAQWREDNNKMLIADTTELLHKIIDGSDVPFIYEKTGTHIRHYMIDEFQDTSGMQWENFRPLLKESLDNGLNNLIVGDVKQSIYRFRNSDWTLLNTQVKKDFANQINEKNLDVNWRSCRNIVEINNMLFKAIPTQLQHSYNNEIEQSSMTLEERKMFDSQIILAYENSEQNVSKPFADKDGHVKIQFLTDNDDKNWKEQSMELLPETIEKLQDNGYELRDIAILTRTGAESLLSAKTLLEYKEKHPDSKYKYDIISEDSLTINSSLSVQWMVTVLKYLNQPDVASNYYMAQMIYAVLCRKKQETEKKDSGTNDESINGYIQSFTPETIATLKQLSNRSLYELTEGIFRLFEKDFPENELVYIQAFLDTVSEFTTNETADIGQFLTWWDEKGNKQKVITPDSQNAIRITTIHKSKGLGFKVVIIPFADWKIDQKESILWCHAEQKPFDKMKLVPVRYGQILKKTLFATDYFREKLQAYMDNLNNLYVAFTRAKEELIVMAPRPKENITAAKILWDGLQTDEKHPFDTESGIFEYGTWWHTSTKKESEEIEELPMNHFHSVSPDERIQLRLHRNDAFFDDEKRKYGLMMHDILSHIEKTDDIETAITEKHLAGEINETEVNILKKKIISITEKEDVKKWFDGSMNVMNEAEILFGKGQSRRPDRIMIDKNNNVTVIDYKLGEQKEKFHQKQIEKYMSLISEMGYTGIHGFIWYITLNEIEKYDF